VLVKSGRWPDDAVGIGASKITSFVCAVSESRPVFGFNAPTGRLGYMDSGSVQKNVGLKSVACTTFLLAVVLALFLPWLMQGRILGPMDIVSELFEPWSPDAAVPKVHNHFVSDAVTQYLPYRMVAARGFAEDGYSGWNPLVFGGTSQAANTMALSGDWGTQMHRFLSFWTAWHFSVLGRFLIAGLGMLVFLQSRGCKTWVATAMGIAYMLNTEFVSWIYHQWAVASFCWMPWFLWALHGARERSPRYLALAVIFLSLALLGSTLQHAAFIVIALGCVWVGWIFGRRPEVRAETLEWRASQVLASRVRDTVLVTMAGLLAAGLVAFMLEPTVAGYLENVRSGHEREGVGSKYGWSQPLMMALARPLTLYPFVLGSVQTLDLTKALLPGGVAYAFFGTVPMLLAVLGLFSKRVPLAAKLLIGAGLIIPLTPLVAVLYQRVSLLWILGGCWAAGVWLSTASEEELKKLVRWCWRVSAGMLVLWTLASIALVIFRVPLETWLVARAQAAAASSQFTMFPEWVQMRAVKLLDYLCVWNPWQLTALAGLMLSLWGMVRCRMDSFWPGAALALGVALQLSVFWWQWTTWSVELNVYEQPEVVRVLQEEVGLSGRLAQGAGGPGEMPFPPNTLVPAGVAIVGGYDSIHPDGMRSPTGKSWDFPGATHFLGGVDEEKPEGWQAVWTDGRWVLLRNPAPKVGMATLESGLPVPLRPADFKRGSMNTMEAVVPAGAVTLELFSNWHRGWKWRDDPEGRWIETSAGPIKGVGVVFDRPAVETKVVYLQFDPSPPNWVWVVSGLSAVLILALALSGRKDDEAAR
jgi:hypothetical protein